MIELGSIVGIFIFLLLKWRIKIWCKFCLSFWISVLLVPVYYFVKCLTIDIDLFIMPFSVCAIANIIYFFLKTLYENN